MRTCTYFVPYLFLKSSARHNRAAYRIPDSLYGPAETLDSRVQSACFLARVGTPKSAFYFSASEFAHILLASYFLADFKNYRSFELLELCPKATREQLKTSSEVEKDGVATPGVGDYRTSAALVFCSFRNVLRRTCSVLARLRKSE